MLPAARAEGAGAPLMTALFTATSAVCVTGLIVVDTGTYSVLTRPMDHPCAVSAGWLRDDDVGHLAGAARESQIRLRSRLMLQAETHSLALGTEEHRQARLDGDGPGRSDLTLALWLRLTGRHDMGAGTALWHAFFHAVSAFNNAGFSTWGDSVIRFSGDGLILLPLMTAIVVGGLGFPVLHELLVLRRRVSTMTIHSTLTLWGTAALIVGGTLALLWVESGNVATLAPMDWSSRLLAAAFTSVSARTAGFNAIDIGSLTVESLNLHYLLMFIGGGSAGTAGGVKVTTFFILLLVVWNEVRGHEDVEFRNRRISTAAQRQALSILVLSAGTIVIATLAILPLTRLPYDKVLFEVISAFATVGLSTGITAELPVGGQAVLVVLMFTGRVGVVTLAAAIATNHARRSYRYPEEKPIVG